MSNHALHVCFVLMFMVNTPWVNCDMPAGWADPGDMLRYDTNTKTMVPEKPKVPPSREIQQSGYIEKERSEAAPPSCPQSEFHFYKRFIRSLLAQFMSELHLSEDTEEMQFDVLMKLTASELAVLKSYVSPASKVAVHDVDEILTHLIKRIRLYQAATEYEGGSTWLERLLQQAQDKADVIAAILAGILVIFIFRQLSPTRALVLGLVLLFVAGSVYEGINMYQKLEAEKFAERHKLATIPEHCNPEAVSFFRRIGWSLQVNLLGMDDPCKKYYELLMVDTRFQINPLQVATSALGKVFETMAKFCGSAFGLFYSKALGHFNFFEKILFVIVITIVSIAAVMYMGPAMVFSIPSLLRSMRRPQIREMVENLPQDQRPPIQYQDGIPPQKTPQAVTLEPCPRCGTHDVEVPLRSSPNRITITSGNKCISIEDVEPLVAESPGARMEVCTAPGNGDSKSIDANPESSTKTSVESVENSQ